MATRGRPDAELGLAVDFDPAVWLPGPTDGDAEAWTAAALAAVTADFGVIEGSSEHSHLHEVLHGFATAELGCDFRFLKLCSPVDAPTIVMLHVYAGHAASEFDAVLTEFEADTLWYDARPVLTTVDEQTGLRRSLRYGVADGRLTSVIRYHRRVEEAAADIVLSSAGADLRTTALVLGDLDSLAKAVRLVDGRGTRR